MKKNPKQVAVKQIRSQLHRLNNIERKKYIDSLVRGFCLNCGNIKNNNSYNEYFCPECENDLKMDNFD